MNADALRERQAPLKSRYKEDPAAARLILSARGVVSQDTVTCALTTGKPGVAAGLHPATGGDGTAACSGDMLLEALVSCAGVTLAAVATSMGIRLDRAEIAAAGELDFRGTLGVAKDAPVGFTHVRVTFEIASEAPREKLDKLVELTHRYCVVAQTLAKGATIELALA